MDMGVSFYNNLLKFSRYREILAQTIIVAVWSLLVMLV